MAAAWPPLFAAASRQGSLRGVRQGVRVELDDPAVLAEVRAVFDRYEAALMASRAEELDAIFWADPRTVRFGITEILYGHDAIRAFRSSVKAYAQRVQRRVHIVAFGSDFAATHLEYERVGTGLIGRETKIMARLPEGWRVVSAHVSLLAGGDPGREMRGAR
ncbi:AtzH-like domain-containing protein [Falsiroseomonas sp. HW251]|uniref:AtzH-like domain-containing protein n=1 Tax=Falsiroseomonas sp. HW251 TaxID=3390998 RepID=UPI003D315FB6